MPEGNLNILDKTTQETSNWLREISEEMNHPDRQVAYHALRGTLFALRDRLAVEEAVDLAAQLPALIRGIYFEGYKPSGKPLNYRDRDTFLERVNAEMEAVRPANTEDAARAVLTVLGRHVSPGEVEEARQMLPKAVRNLWQVEEATAEQ